MRRCLVASTLVVTMSGCGGADAPAVTAPPPAPTTARIDITAPSTSVALGDRLQLTSKVYQAGSSLLSQAKPTWSLSDSTKARVDSNGLVTGFATGTVDVKADYLGILGQFRVTLTAGTGAWGPGYIYGGTDNDGGENIVSDAAGNIYVAGSTAGTVDQQTATPQFGSADAIVTRFLPNGKKAWTRVVPTSGQNGANGIALHRNGGVVVNSSNVFGSHVSYVDASGRIVWSNFLYNAGFNDVATDRAGNVYVTGNAIRQNGTSICPGVPLPAPNSITTGGAGDGILLKYSPDGQQLWCRLWTFVLSDQPEPKRPMFDTQGVAITIDETRGSIFIGGVVQANAVYGLAPFVRRFTLADGTSDWSRFINPGGLGAEPAGRIGNSLQAGMGLLHAVAVDPAGNVWAGLSEDSIGTFSDRGYSAYFVKLSETGTELLRRPVNIVKLAPTGSQNGRAVTAIAYRAPQNDMIMISSYGGSFVSRGNYPNGTVLAFDLAGTEKWRSLIAHTDEGFATYTSIRALTSLANGDIFVVGDTYSGSFPGFLDEAPAGFSGFDILVTRLTGRP